jgi:hypothetical protein
MACCCLIVDRYMQGVTDFFCALNSSNHANCALSMPLRAAVAAGSTVNATCLNPGPGFASEVNITLSGQADTTCGPLAASASTVARAQYCGAQCAGVSITPDFGGLNESVVCGADAGTHTVPYRYSTPVPTSVTITSPTVSGCNGVYELGAYTVKAGAAGARRGVQVCTPCFNC